MKINDDVDLANVLGRAFRTYANQVENGLTQPYTAFIDGLDCVDVTVFLHADGSIVVKPLLKVVHLPVNVEVTKPILEAQEITVAESGINEPEQSEDVEVLDQKALEENKVIITKRKRKTE
jgi:hypothetical protein